MNDIQSIDNTYIAHTYARFPVEIVSGKGSEVFDADGRRYIDMGSGIGVTSFGIADDIWQQAVIDQLGRVQHMSNLYYTAPGAKLAQLLCEKTGMKKVFFCNSGAEANECAVKVARKYAAGKKGAAYSTIITLENSFHGRTLTTLAATGQPRFHEQFQPLTPGFVHTPANDVAALTKAVQSHPTAAILLECIQGEGGVLPLELEFVQEAAKLARENDSLLMIDEVQTGNGRTGSLYAYMDYGIQPDVVTTAKGLGGGLPIGAILFGDKAKETLGPGDHGSTFGGNPVCCAGAISILERIDEQLLTEVRQKGAYIFDVLTGAPGVKAVSGRGLMVGILSEKPAAEVVNRCLENGVLCLTAHDRVRLLPALNIPMETLIEAMTVLKSALA